MRKIFKWLTADSGSEQSGAYAYWVSNMFTPTDFSGVDSLLLCFIKYCSRLAVVPRIEFLEAYLAVDGKRDVKKFNIKTDTMSSYDYRQTSQLEEAYRIIAGLAKTTYAEYVSDDLTGRDFKVDADTFMSEKKSAMLQETMMKTYPRLTDGSDITEVTEDLMSSIVAVKETYDKSKIKDIDFAPSSSSDQSPKMEYICDTGIPALDNDMGGLYTKLLITLNAQSKSGKTRLALANFVYPVLCAGGDVLFYEAELQKSQVENILIAYHITRLYKGRIKIPDQLMNRKNGLTDEQKQIYESAKIDLFDSGRYGKFYFRKPFVVERAYDEIVTLNKTTDNLKLVVNDYMGLSKSVPTSKWEARKEDYKIISEAYETLGNVRDNMDVCVLCINQYNDKGTDAAEAGKPIRQGMIQGGHIATRHTDYDINMTYTNEQKLAGVRSLSADLVRGYSGFGNVLLSLDLSVSIFRQELSRQ